MIVVKILIFRISSIAILQGFLSKIIKSAIFPSLIPVMIHCQILQPEQLPQLKRIGMIPSFFVNHIYYWGDIHLKNLGKRANQISCIHSALKQELPYTFHQDSPVILPNMLESVWCACKRETKAGLILGENEQISVYNALKGVTINAAYQYFEEKYKGSIKEGKIADLIILDKNPCKIAFCLKTSNSCLAAISPLQ